MRLTLTPAGRRVQWQALRRTYRRFGPYVLRHRVSLWVAFGCLLGSMATTVLGPWPLKIVIDQLVRTSPKRALPAWLMPLSDSPALLLGVVCASVIAIAVAAGVFAYGQRLMTAQVAHRVLLKIRRDVFAHVQRLPLAFHADRQSGDLVMRMTGDVQMLREILITAVMKLMGQVFVIAGMLAMMLWLSPLLALVALAVVPGLVLVMSRFSGRLREVTRRQRRKESQVASHINETMSSISVVHSFARHRMADERMARQNRGSLRAGLAATRLEEQMSRWVEITVAVGTCGVLTLGTHLAMTQVITAGTLIVFLSYVRSFYKPLRDLSRMWARLSKASVCAERILDLLDIEPTIRDAPDAVEAPGFAGRVTFDSVRLAYPGRTQPALDAINLDVAPGETVLIVGPSGAGKTSLIRLILRLYDPDSGAVRIDGVDIRRYRVESLRDQIAVVLQNTTLFRGSIRDNIAYGKPAASDEEIEQAARHVFAHSFIETLPAGYDTVVGEGGVTLSGGERQRIALARAAIKNAPVLVMDEPTTGLDAAAQRHVRQGMRALVSRCTTFVVSHQPELFGDVDRVVSFAGGRIVEQGRWEDLAAGNTAFARSLGAGRVAGGAARKVAWR
ncbi:MAG: ABC transporter ATP-binding protein [Acidobacteriota bacterium]